MDQQIKPATPTIGLSIPRWEFIALAAALMALNALAIDIMLPGLQQIGASLGVADENARQYVISAYFGGLAFALLGIGQAVLALANIPTEERSSLFLIRLSAFALILFAILRKNRAAS